MLQAVLNYLAIDAVASLVVLAVLYLNRNQVKRVLRNFLEVPERTETVSAQSDNGFDNGDDYHDHAGCDCE